MPTVEVVRLRGISETVRQLPAFYGASTIAGHYFRVVREGAGFIREAETLGAFHGDSVYGRIGKKLKHPRCHLENVVPTPAGPTPAWKLCVWYAVVDTLKPELIGVRSRSTVVDASGQPMMQVDTSEQEAALVADAIDKEADRIETEVVAEADRSRPTPPEWSRPVGKQELQKMLGPISRNTLNSRLVEGATPAHGKIRYQAPAHARKIQVAVNDLPADVQTRFRKSAKQ
jgi:hypothetical protein